MIIFHDKIGFESESAPTRISFVMVGIWWVGFAQISFYALKRFEYKPPVKEVIDEKQRLSIGSLFGGYLELKKVWMELRHIRSLRNYLLAFFFYNSAVQTVMYLASIFGSEVIFKDDPGGQTKLIACVLIIQLVAIAGAMIFSRISRQEGKYYQPDHCHYHLDRHLHLCLCAEDAIAILCNCFCCWNGDGRYPGHLEIYL
jgi:UMF1 family MFS transporter